MLEQKQKILFKEPSFQEVIFEGKVIKVKPYISLMDMGVIGGVYLEKYFSGSPSHVIDAEYSLMATVLDQCTNLEIEEGSFGGFVANVKVWDDIVAKIKNYGTFRALLRQSVEERKETLRLENTTGRVISVLSSKVLELIDKLSSTEITPESIEKVKDLLKEVESSTVFKKVSDKIK